MKTLLAVCLASACAHAEDDLAALYEIKSEATPAALAAGGRGKVSIEIVPKAGAHVSDQAPLKQAGHCRFAPAGIGAGQGRMLFEADSYVGHARLFCVYPR